MASPWPFRKLALRAAGWLNVSVIVRRSSTNSCMEVARVATSMSCSALTPCCASRGSVPAGRDRTLPRTTRMATHESPPAEMWNVPAFLSALTRTGVSLRRQQQRQRSMCEATSESSRSHIGGTYTLSVPASGPSPSCPRLFAPHAHTLPSAASTMVCCCPAAAALRVTAVGQLRGGRVVHGVSGAVRAGGKTWRARGRRHALRART